MVRVHQGPTFLFIPSLYIFQKIHYHPVTSLIKDFLQAAMMVERPIECTECGKEITHHFTYVDEGSCTTTQMCEDCPVLHKHLKGIEQAEYSSSLESNNKTGLCCGECGTTLEEVKLGSPLGCPECYEIFSDVLLLEMLSRKKISSRLHPSKKAAPLHIGRIPGKSKDLSPKLQLIALNEALSDTLSREDYEQAAKLRDQIKKLKKKSDEKGV